MKKRLIIIFMSIIILLFIAIYIMIFLDNRYNDNIIDSIKDECDIKNIDYVNFYDNYYIAMNNEYLYLINNDYDIITKIDVSLIYNNKNNYDIVYKDKTIMYMDNYMNKDKLVFEYYDIYTYELIDKVIVGGN